jgi:hypothetical protein
MIDSLPQISANVNRNRFLEVIAFLISKCWLKPLKAKKDFSEKLIKFTLTIARLLEGVFLINVPWENSRKTQTETLQFPLQDSRKSSTSFPIILVKAQKSVGIVEMKSLAAN